MTSADPVPILLAIHSLGHGGSERQLANIAMSVDRSRFSPHVVSVHGGFQADAMRRENIPVLHLPLRSFVTPGVLKVAWQLRNYIRERNIRLVHTFDYTLSLLGIPVARSCSGVIALSSQRCYMELVPPKYKTLLLRTHSMAQGVVANCEALRDHLARDFGFPPDRVPVCYNGLDTERFSPSHRTRLDGTAGASLVIGTVCVLRPEKNIGQLLEAFVRVRSLRPGLQLVIIGSGPEKERLEKMSTTLGIADDCLFFPSTPDVPSAMRGIDIFVHPSLSEGLPNAVMEAMACGCMVVTSRVGGCPEIVEEGSSGFLTHPGDLDDLTRQLGTAVSDDVLRVRMSAAAAERMRHFSLADSAARMQQIYQSYLTPIA